MRAADKIKLTADLKRICESVRRKGGRIVFTNGCFDILHIGHVRYIEDARALGDLLIVAVNSDRSVKQIKGDLRPIIGEAERAETVAALQAVDYVTLFDTPDPLPLIETLKPDILVKGADWAPDRIIGAETVVGAGGRVERIPLTPGISTSVLIERILSRFG
ncbi:MAG: D-glycero-beta-D-manno-heptose 1-phosphate adenylyltransferase [Syntrophobacteraceae bacterium]|nr:D-glycero-beta-D-manno-heptose 1-phosphate adenylyltransferase [Syntrophobacteraceae bacterium]